MKQFTGGDRGLRLALAGGGTGGHVVPGLHLLDGLCAAGVRIERVVWFGAGRAIEARVLGDAGALLEGLSLRRVELALEPAGGGAPSKAGLAVRLPRALRRARAVLEEERIDAVCGLGGFVSAPVILGAWRAGIPRLMLEVNAVAGRATRGLGRFSDIVAHAHPGSVGRRPRDGRVEVTGPPLASRFRPDAVARVDRPEFLRAFGLDPLRPLLLCLGGSQGALGLNRFLAQHARAFADAGLAVLHQTGPGRATEGAAAIPGAYAAVDFLGDVQPALLAAELVLARGGASTLAEIAALRRPAVIVPYPHHADQHQLANARAFGAGMRVMPEDQLDARRVPELVALAGPAGRALRAELVRELERAPGAVNGTQRLVELVCELAARTPTASGSRVEAVAAIR